jgi:hypothetical protein
MAIILNEYSFSKPKRGLPAFLPPFLIASNVTAEKLFAQSGTTFAQALEAV